MISRRNGLRAAVAGVMLASALFVAASPAQAACRDARIGVMTVCAQDLSLRTDCYYKAWSGVLERGDKFRVDIDYGSWVYGYSYKHNRHGCVQDGWFM